MLTRAEYGQIALNLLAWRSVLPRLRERWIHPYHGDWTPDHLARSAVEQLERYLAVLSRSGCSPEGRRVLEVGTGSHLGVAVGLLAAGAREVTSVDLDRLHRDRPRIRAVYRHLMVCLPAALPRRASAVELLKRLAAGERPPTPRYLCPCDITGSGLPSGTADLVVSYSVMEHVRDPAAALREMERLLAPGGLMVHCVDLADHLWQEEPLRFLRYPERVFALMAGNRSIYCNRWRLPDYLEGAAAAGLAPARLEVVRTAQEDYLQGELPRLAPEFRRYRAEDLRVLGFTMLCRKPPAGEPIP